MMVGERRRKIVDVLESDDRAQVGELAARFGVSHSTIRRDLQLLSKSGVVERTHGGVLHPSRFEPSFGQKETENRGQKRAIARAAAQLVQPGHTVFLDGGTTTLELARELRSRNDITIASNSVPIAVELANRVRLILTGGSVKESTLALVGPIAERSIEQMHVDIAFIGMNGVSSGAGFTTPTWEEAATKVRMIHAGRVAVVLADGSKLGTVTFAHVARPDEVDLLITDEAASAAEVEALRAAGLQVRLAPYAREAIA
ncbi:MAG: DeoR/GlpR family DNA-binding transcription regulator [Chloroflexota bacterium]|nr:DeoR/GlpR family DNA-binding transcription regulator [Chloroflexota bacterium]